MHNNQKEIRVLDSFSDNEYFYQVSDHLILGAPNDDTRNLSFKSKEMPCFYLHSSVYIDTAHIRQPIYCILQDIVEIWSCQGSISRALILGCAGCTIPRFLVLRYPECFVVGVELSVKMIEIAHKYFFIDEFDKRFLLLHDDAFLYFDHCSNNEKYDLIYVDLFHGAFISKDVFSANFLSAQKCHLSSEALIAVNLLDVELERIQFFAKTACRFYEGVALVYQDTRAFLLITNDRSKYWSKFLKAIAKKYRVVIY